MNKKAILLGQQDTFRGETGKFILSKDWSRNSIGEIRFWPDSLTSFVRLCLNAQFPAIIWWGREFVQIYNDTFAKVFHIPPESLGTKGKDFQLWSSLGDSLREVLENGKATEVRRKLGLNPESVTGEREFIFYHTPIVAASGTVEGVFTIVSEPPHETVSRKQDNALEFSEQRYFKMTEEVQDYAIILLDKDGTILNWNKGAQKIKGYKDEEIVGKNFSVFYLEADRRNKLPEELINQAEREGRAMHEGWRKRKDGSKFWGSIVITALHDSDGNVIGFSKVTRDLTERKLAEDTMRQHTAELEMKNKQLEQFAYIASHDLQEPLRKIQTFIQVLERKLGEPEARQKYFNKINSSAKRMADLIQSVLNYSRLSQNEDELVPIDLNVILENVKGDYELQIEEKKAVINSDSLPFVKGEPLQLHQLFANLIGNSLKFSKTDPRIIISSRTLQPDEIQKINPSLDNTRRYVQLSFKDNGIGFEQQYAEKIFTIFQRLNSREEYSGTGIGLALCKRIVDHHHGHIEAVSVLGQGATFLIYLPLE
ncbi:MAG TPA: PAS domain S-box protein [Chryseolinea sp.]|nr:PAS domain S-box protein [Chryseolinea sp.]